MAAGEARATQQHILDEAVAVHARYAEHCDKLAAARRRVSAVSRAAAAEEQDRARAAAAAAAAASLAEAQAAALAAANSEAAAAEAAVAAAVAAANPAPTLVSALKAQRSGAASEPIALSPPPRAPKSIAVQAVAFEVQGEESGGQREEMRGAALRSSFSRALEDASGPPARPQTSRQPIGASNSYSVAAASASARSLRSASESAAVLLPLPSSRIPPSNPFLSSQTASSFVPGVSSFLERQEAARKKRLDAAAAAARGAHAPLVPTSRLLIPRVPKPPTSPVPVHLHTEDRALHWHEIEEARHAAEAAAASEAAAEAEAQAAAEAAVALAAEPIAASVAHNVATYASASAPALIREIPGERGPASPIPRKSKAVPLEARFVAEVERLTERELEELVARGERASDERASDAAEVTSPVAFIRGVAAEQVYAGLAASTAGEISRLQVDLASALNGLKFTTN